MTRLLGRRSTPVRYVECRRCGTTLSSASVDCPNCGSDRSVTYEFD
ncbi:MAG: hypothetical protein ABEJ70_00060 [Halobacteriaceae archaeon]